MSTHHTYARTQCALHVINHLCSISKRYSRWRGNRARGRRRACSSPYLSVDSSFFRQIRREFTLMERRKESRESRTQHDTHSPRECECVVALTMGDPAYKGGGESKIHGSRDSIGKQGINGSTIYCKRREKSDFSRF